MNRIEVMVKMKIMSGKVRSGGGGGGEVCQGGCEP